MLRKLTRFIVFVLYLVSSGYLLSALFSNGLKGSHYLFAALFATQLFGFIIGSVELFLLHGRAPAQTGFGQSDHVGVLCFVQKENLETLRISLLSLKHLRGSPRVYIFSPKYQLEVESLCSEFGFEYVYESFDPPQQFDQYLITNGHTIVYPDAILVAQRRLDDNISFVELNHTNYSAHALSEDKGDRDISRAYLIAAACGSHSIPMAIGGPILAQRRHSNFENLTKNLLVPSFPKVVANIVSTGRRGTITSHPCCECMSHSEVDHNIASRADRVRTSLRLTKHLEFVDNAKGILRRYIGWYYMRFFWLRSIGVLLFLSLIPIIALTGIDENILTVSILGSFTAAQISNFILSRMLGDYRSPLDRLREIILDCEAFVYAVILTTKKKYHISNLHIRLFPFYLSVLSVFTLFSSAFIIFDVGFMSKGLTSQLVTLAFLCSLILASYLSMYRYLSARQREFARRSVSITGSSSYESMWIVDLTHRGAAYVSDTSFDIGQETPLVFRVPTADGDSLITVVGKVTYCAPRGDRYQVGVAFKELSRQALDDLTLYCSILYPYRQARRIDESENLFDNVDFSFPSSGESKRNMLSLSVYLFVFVVMSGLALAQINVVESPSHQSRKVTSSVSPSALAATHSTNSQLSDYESLILSNDKTQQYTISSTVYVDNDLNGSFSTGDEPLSGIGVELYEQKLNQGESPVPLDRSTTDGNGQYSFRFISPGSYFVKILDFGEEFEVAKVEKSKLKFAKTQSGYKSRTFNVSSQNNGSISELEASFQRKYDLTISSELVGLTAFGFLPGDRVTYRITATNNGPAVALGGFRVLSELGADFDAKTARMTDTGGFSPCGFDVLRVECISNSPLAPGESRSFEFSIISNITTSTDSIRRSIISSVEPSKLDRSEAEPNHLNTNNSENTIIPVGQPNAIGGRVFFDTNRNGVLDSGEFGISGVRVGLLEFKDINGNGIKDPGETPEIASDVTDQLGYYGVASGKSTFQSLTPGAQYGLVFTKLPKGFSASVVDLDEDDLGQGDKKKPNNSLPWLGLEPSHVRTDSNYGLISSSKNLFKKVFVDINKDLKQTKVDLTPKGLDGRLFQWIDINSNNKVDSGELSKTPIGISSLDNHGKFNFTNVQDSIFPTKYALEIDLPDGYKIKNNDKHGTVRSKFESLDSFNSEKIILEETGSIISGNYWIDFNYNGKHDEREFGARNLDLVLTDKSGKVVSTTRTNNEGDYKFEEVPSGTFFLGIHQDSIPKGFILESIGNKFLSKGDYGRLDFPIQIRSNSGQQIRSIALTPASGIKGKVVDPQISGSSTLNDEKVIWGSGINLTSDGKFIGATKTSEKGNFDFQNLKPGNYELQVENDSFQSIHEMVLVPGISTLNINESKSTNIPIKVEVSKGKFQRLSLSSALDTKARNTLVMVSIVSAAGIVLVLARRKKLFYRGA